MKIKMHRIFAFVLVFAMLLSVFPMNATAAEHEHIKQTESEPMNVGGNASYSASDRGPTRDNPQYFRIDSEADFGSDIYAFIVDGPADDANYTNYALLITPDANNKAGLLSSPAKFDSTPSIITAGSALAWTVTYSGGKWTIKDASGNYLVDTTDSTGYGLELSTTADTTWTVTEDGEDKFVITSSKGNVLSLRTDISGLSGSNGQPLFSMASSKTSGCCYFNVYRQNCPHTYAYACKYDGTHDRYCTVCGAYENFSCTMSNGKCTACGYTGDHTLSFIVPDGVDPIEPISGSMITAPAPHGAPSVNPENATFIGWTNKVVDYETEKPTIYYAGRTYNLPEDVTLYALYSYADSMTFTLYDGSSALALGDRIAFVAYEQDYAMSRTQNANNRASETITKNGNTFTVSSADNVAIINVGYGVHGSAETQQYSFHDGTGYLAPTSSSKNYLRTVAELDENSTWAYSIEDTTCVATVNSEGEFTRNTLRFNASNKPPLFSCYDPSNTTLNKVQIYKLTSESGVTYTTEFEEACDHMFTYESNDDGTHTAICSVCGYSEENDCNLTENVCPDCGYSVAVAYVVSFVVPEGVNEIDPISASELVLPTPSGMPDFNYNDATFIGWTFDPVDNVDEMPPVLDTTTTYPITEDMTLYALYSYTNEGGSVYALYDGTRDIKAGDKAIIVAKDYDFAISTTQNTNNRVAAPITKDGRNITVTDADNVQMFTIEDGLVDGTIAFATDSGYLSAASSSGNYLKTPATLSENGSWLYELDPATKELALTAQGAYTRNTMRFNKSSSIFACYAPTNTQHALQLYIRTIPGGGTFYTTEFSAENCPHELTFTSNGDGTHTVECGNCDYLGEEDCNLADGPCPDCGYEKECLHDFVYTSNGDGTHSVECGNCDYIGEEDCDLANGPCPACGYEKECLHDFIYTANGDGTHTVECANCDYVGEEDCDLADGPCPACGYEKECLHDFIYTSNGDGTHTVECANCDYVGEEDCDFADGPCPACGYEVTDEYTLSFVVPAGVNAIEPIVGSKITLPTPNGTPNNNYYNAVFVGWTAQPVEDSAQEPIFYPANTQYVLEEDTTFYALYSYGGSGAVFSLYDGSDDISVGSEAIIVAKDFDYAISSTQNSNNRAPAEITKSGDNTIALAAGSNVAVFTIEEGIADGLIAFKDDKGYLRAASSTANYLRTGADIDENSSWSYTVDPLDFSINLVAQGSFTKNTMRYNKSSNLFACYAAENSQQALQLYTATEGVSRIYTTVFSDVCPHTDVSVDELPPTCEEPGYYKEICDLCGEILVDQSVAENGHDYIAETIPPTCLDDGYTIYTCCACGDSYTDDIVPGGEHDYIGVVTTPATCAAPGVMTYTCDACGDSFTEVIASGGHTYDEGEVTKPASCGVEGVFTYTCTGCGDTYTETLPSLEHEYVVTVVEATCGDRGYTNYSCIHCGDSYEEDYVDATGDHDYIAEFIDATCSEQGYTLFTCDICGDTFKDDFTPVDENAHVYVPTVVEPTCTEDGYTLYACACGKSYTANTVPATDHDHVATVVAPTCDADGYTNYSCINCGESYQAEFVAKLGHAYTYTDNGQTHTIACERCDLSVVEDHKWNDGEVITQPTCGVNGVTRYTCQVCNATKTETVVSGNHSVTFVPEQAATCEASGVMAHFKCSSCGKFFLNEACTYELPGDYIIIAPVGHNYIYRQLNATQHTVICTNGCGYTAAEVHKFVDGTCACGEKKSSEPVYNKDLKFTMSISIGAEMLVTYNLMAGTVSSYSDFYLEVKKDVAGGDPIVTTYGIANGRVAMGCVNHPTTGEALMYNAKYMGINAKEMGDNFSTTLYVVAADGTVYYSDTLVTSIKDFLISKIDDAKSSAELKTMAADMLKYGAAAQVRLKYDTANLVTADLTAEQLAYATKELPEASDDCISIGEGKNITTSLAVAARVELTLNCVYTPTDASAMKFVIIDTESGTMLQEIPVNVMGGVFCTGKFNEVGAREMRRLITVILYEGDKAVSKMMTWSLESYVAQTRANAKVAQDELNMVNAMLIYGDSVAAYMKSIEK